jgi:hypothetical protein
VSAWRTTTNVRANLKNARPNVFGRALPEQADRLCLRTLEETIIGPLSIFVPLHRLFPTWHRRLPAAGCPIRYAAAAAACRVKIAFVPSRSRIDRASLLVAMPGPFMRYARCASVSR